MDKKIHAMGGYDADGNNSSNNSNSEGCVCDNDGGSGVGGAGMAVLMADNSVENKKDCNADSRTLLEVVNHDRCLQKACPDDVKNQGSLGWLARSAIDVFTFSDNVFSARTFGMSPSAGSNSGAMLAVTAGLVAFWGILGVVRERRQWFSYRHSEEGPDVLQTMAQNMLESAATSVSFGPASDFGSEEEEQEDPLANLLAENNELASGLKRARADVAALEEAMEVMTTSWRQRYATLLDENLDLRKLSQEAELKAAALARQLDESAEAMETLKRSMRENYRAAYEESKLLAEQARSKICCLTKSLEEKNEELATLKERLRSLEASKVLVAASNHNLAESLPVIVHQSCHSEMNVESQRRPQAFCQHHNGGGRHLPRLQLVHVSEICRTVRSTAHSRRRCQRQYV